MPSGTSLVAFSVAALVLLLLPGPGVLYIVTRSLSQGRRAGLVSAMGLSTGAMVHVVAAVAGLSAILMTSATAFSVVKFIGAAYLIYLGVAAFRGGDQAAPEGTPEYRSLRKLFTDGVLVSVFNPKIAIFFLAFLPQFTDPERGPIWLQITILGTLYSVLALFTDGSYAMLAGSARRWLSRGSPDRRWPRYLSGSIYIGLGVSTAFAGPSTTD